MYAKGILGRKRWLCHALYGKQIVTFEKKKKIIIKVHIRNTRERVRARILLPWQRPSWSYVIFIVPENKLPNVADLCEMTSRFA